MMSVYKVCIARAKTISTDFIALTSVGVNHFRQELWSIQ